MSGVRMIVVCVVALLAAGCTGGDDEPRSLPTITAGAAPDGPSPTVDDGPVPTPTPTGEPTPEPRDGMHEYSPAGVDAFTHYVIDVINYANRTNDVSPLEAIAAPDCQFCANIVDRLTFVADQGGRVEGGQFEPTGERFDIIGPAEGFETSAGVRLAITASRTVDGDGDIRNTAEREDRYVIFDFARENEQWRLAEVRYGLDE